MDLSTMDSLIKKEKDKEMVCLYVAMVIYILENGNRIPWLKVTIYSKMEKAFKVW